MRARQNVSHQRVGASDTDYKIDPTADSGRVERALSSESSIKLGLGRLSVAPSRTGRAPLTHPAPTGAIVLEASFLQSGCQDVLPIAFSSESEPGCA